MAGCNRVYGVSFGCNRRKTCEKTEASKEEAAEEDLEKERSLT